MALLVVVDCMFASYGLVMFRGLLAVFAVAASLLLVASLSPGAVSWVLSRPPLPYLGRISYSLYLWHVPILVAFGVLGSPVFPARSLPVRIVAVWCSFLAAAASYHLVEQPFQRRRRSRRPASAQLAPVAVTAIVGSDMQPQRA